MLFSTRIRTFIIRTFLQLKRGRKNGLLNLANRYLREETEPDATHTNEITRRTCYNLTPDRQPVLRKKPPKYFNEIVLRWATRDVSTFIATYTYILIPTRVRLYDGNNFCQN